MPKKINPYKNVPKKNQGGNCYKQAITFMFQERDNPHLRLCHGWVTGTGVIKGIRFSHAWVDDLNTRLTIDPSTNLHEPLIVPTFLYYKLANIKEKRVHRYTFLQMQKHLENTRKAGPWNKEFDEFPL